MTYAPQRIGVTSSNSLFFGLILLGHLGFFWLLNSGLDAGRPIASVILDVIKVEALASQTVPRFPPPPPVPTIDVEAPTLAQPVVEVAEPSFPDASPTPTPSTSSSMSDERETSNRVALPLSHPRWPLTPPAYPAASQRLDEEGRVVLDVYVLENGRVSDARVFTSSGYARLDQAALEEVKRGWRLLPGTEDGKPTAMWVRLAVNFKLNKGR